MASITASTSVVQLNAPTHFPIKLTPTNYSVWSRQIQSSLIGHDLVGYIDGTLIVPSKTIESGDVNPLYMIWYRQDQIIVSALLGSCSESIQPSISTAATARDVWIRLSTTYASTTPGRVLFLKAQLAKNPRGNRTITDYMKEMGDIADSLALAGHPISDSDLVASIITQLGDEYRSVYSALRVRETAVSLADLTDILLDIERLISTPSDAPPLLPSVNQTQPRSHTPSIGGSPSPNFGGRRGGRGHRGRGGRHGGRNSPFTHGQQSSTSFCEYCSYSGHTARVCRKLAAFLREHNIVTQTSPQVHNTQPHGTTPPQPSWIFDTGASHHTANSAASFHSFSDYGGPDEIHLGNGNLLPITHIGHSTIPTPSRSLSLSRILCAPSLNCNLISVSQLCHTNRVSVEFFPSHFLVKGESSSTGAER